LTSSRLRALRHDFDDERLWRREAQTCEEHQHRKAKQKKEERESETKRVWQYVRGRMDEGQEIDPNTLGKNECLLAMKYVVDELDVLDNRLGLDGRRQGGLSGEREKRRSMLKEAAWRHIESNLMDYVVRIENEIFPQFKHRDLYVARRALAEALREWRRRQEAEKRRQ